MGRAYAALGGPLITQCGDTSLFPVDPVIACVDAGYTTVLYKTPRTNYVLYSDDLARAGSTTNMSAVALAGDFGAMGQWYRYTATANAVAFSLQSCPVISPSVDVWLRFRRWYRAVAGSVTDARIGAYTESAWGADADSTYAILSGPGTLSRVTGSRINISGLSTATSTLVEVIRLVRAGETASIYSYVRLGTSQAVTGDQIDLSPVEIVDIAGRHITTTTAAVTRTDYTYSSASGVISLAQSGETVTADGAACTGSGSTWQAPPFLF